MDGIDTPRKILAEVDRDYKSYDALVRQSEGRKRVDIPISLTHNRALSSAAGIEYFVDRAGK